MAAFECQRIEPDAGEQVEMLIVADSLADGLEEFLRDVESGFFAGLERGNGCASAAGGAVIAGCGEWCEE